MTRFLILPRWPGEDRPGRAVRGAGPLSVVGDHGGGELTPVAKVLVVDDDPSLLRAMHLGLHAHGHEVITAVNGEQGISQTALASP